MILLMFSLCFRAQARQYMKLRLEVCVTIHYTPSIKARLFYACHWLEMESLKDLKWISIVSLGTFFIVLFNYALAGGYYWNRRSLWEASAYGFTVVFLFLNFLTLTVSTLFTSGIRHKKVYQIATSFFVVSMLFFVLALVLTLARSSLTFGFMS